MPSIRTAFIDAGYDQKEDGASATHDSEFLVSVNGSLYHLFGDYAWERDERGIYVIGSGGELALGALEALDATSAESPAVAAKILKKAVAIAIKHDVNSGGKVHVYTQSK